MRKPLVALLLCGCLGGSLSPARAAAAAETRPLYNVEVIIFRNLAPLGSPEQWSSEALMSGAPAAGASEVADAPAAAGPTGPAPRAAATAASSVAPAATPAATGSPSPPTPARTSEHSPLVRLLPSASFQLTGLESRLRASGRYAPVAHVAWSQTASPWGKPIAISLAELGIAVSGLSGTVALERGTFLHLDLRLDYAMQDPPAALNAAPGTVFALHQVHRVRFYLRNYFDHPAFGVLAIVTPAQGSRRAGR